MYTYETTLLIYHHRPTPTKEENEKAAEPIAPTLGVKYPPNPHLRYKYPDPTPGILGNITNAMGSVPRFYTQVLHLMNKLNLSPPFGPLSEQIMPANLRKRRKDDLLASDESELSDDHDEEMTAAQQEQVVKRARLNRMAAKQQKQALKSAPKTSTTVKPQDQDKIKIVLKKTEAQQAIQDQCKPLSGNEIYFHNITIY
jgi:U11/U12 small nuclear ribonucleoprotein SNRNP65